MEIGGSFLDEEWESLSQIFSSGENLDLFHHHCSGGGGETPSPSFLTNFSQESSEIDEALFLNIHGSEDIPPPPSFDSTAFESMIMNFHSNAGFLLPDHDVIVEEFLRNNKAENRPNLETADSSSQMKRKLHSEADHKSDPQNPNKKSRNAQKNGKVQPKKGKKMIQDNNNEEEMINGGGNRQSCSTYSSEDDSQELNQEINNSNSKTRASRGSATDPQSLYARKRRERINERLKILQNLVPNGTKVDISTMLEEAVQYVKFLQLQIKLLSSDNMWMYAPLAYNGMDIGIYEKICPNMRQ